MAEFHERLKKAREAAGFTTATDAAKALGIAPPTYLAHENGSRGTKRPAPAKIRQYARAFKVNYGWLAAGQGPMKGEVEALMLGELSPDQAKVLKDLYEQFRRQKV